MSVSNTQGLPGSTPSSVQTLNKSKVIGVLLVISGIALLAIGVLASKGIFQFMGTTNAAYLSYGMYAGFALCLIAVVIGFSLAQRRYRAEWKRQAAITEKQNQDEMKDIKDKITNCHLGDWDIKPQGGAANSAKINYTIKLTDGKILTGKISACDAYLLLQALDEVKCGGSYKVNCIMTKAYYNKSIQPPKWFYEDDEGYRAGKTAKQVYEEMLTGQV